MADVLIRGIKMPEYCYECPCHNGESGYCQAYKSGYLYSIERPAKCPLLPLQEGHGRLIDADALERVCQEIADCDWNKRAAPYSWEYAYQQFIDDEIASAPTIIEAEGGGEDG